MKNTLKIGTKILVKHVVSTEKTIAFMGEELRIYSTPSMVFDLENACRELLSSHHEPGEDSVGARVEVDHLAPTLLDQSIEIACVVKELALPRVVFQVELRDEVDLIGAAVHTRFVIDLLKQKSRIEKKRERIINVS
jgi:predicted thioesterase